MFTQESGTKSKSKLEQKAKEAPKESAGLDMMALKSSLSTTKGQRIPKSSLICQWFAQKSSFWLVLRGSIQERKACPFHPLRLPFWACSPS